MAAVRALCTSCIYLANGELKAQGPVDSIVSEYLRPATQARNGGSVKSRHGIELFDAGIVPDGHDGCQSALHFDEPCELMVRIGAAADFGVAGIVVRIHDEMGVLVSSVCSPEEGVDPSPLAADQTLRFRIPRMSLMPGRYTLGVFVYRPNDGKPYLEADAYTAFEVLPAVVRGGMWPYQHQHGVVRIADGGHWER
jgi:lipopolysaccharide transport system ATP-binding protein